MHSFTLSLFSSSLTPTGSNKGCSITRGNSYLYNKEHLRNLFSFFPDIIFTLSSISPFPLNNLVCKLKSFFMMWKVSFSQKFSISNWNLANFVLLELFSGNRSHHHHHTLSLPLSVSLFKLIYIFMKLLEVVFVSIISSV